MDDEHILYDPLPSGQLCWAIAWADGHSYGWWVQHGDKAEARRFFTRTIVLGPFPPVVPARIVDWMRKAHAYHPCEPRKIVTVG